MEQCSLNFESMENRNHWATKNSIAWQKSEEVWAACGQGFTPSQPGGKEPIESCTTWLKEKETMDLHALSQG
jgi:hypothetical protein